MAVTRKAPDEVIAALRQQLAEAKRLNERSASFVIDKYPEPEPLDFKTAQESATTKTRFGQPVVKTWVVDDVTPTPSSAPRVRVTQMDLSRPVKKPAKMYALKCDALIAQRNWQARLFADFLLQADEAISEAKRTVAQAIITGEDTSQTQE